MARDSKREESREHGEFGESYRTDQRSRPEEGLNAYYTRKQRTKANEFAADADAEFAGPDRNAEKDNYKEPDASFLNYKKWDRYGR